MNAPDLSSLDPFRIPGHDTFEPSVDYWTWRCPFEVDWSELVTN